MLLYNITIVYKFLQFFQFLTRFFLVRNEKSPSPSPGEHGDLRGKLAYYPGIFSAFKANQLKGDEAEASRRDDADENDRCLISYDICIDNIYIILYI